MSTKHTLEILDCTIRDGGYVNQWRFDMKVVREAYRALSKSGVDFVEIGFRAAPSRFDRQSFGAWRTTSEADLREATAGISGPQLALMGNYGEMGLEDLCDAGQSAVSMIRLAAHKHEVFEALALLERIKEKGYTTSLQAMAFGGYTLDEQAALRDALRNTAIDYFYIADSYGALVPNEMAGLFEPFLELDAVKIGFHPHNNLQLAFANTLEAIRLGVHIVDSSIYGMGRGAGNLPTEVLLAYLSTQGSEKYNAIPVLNCIDRYFVDIHKQTPWGYQLPYMVSGMFKCHPYYAAELVKRHEYSIEDVWKALELIDELKPVGFDRGLLKKLIQRGVLGGLGKAAVETSARPAVCQTSECPPPVEYLDRHEGRDFLILANGPSLKRFRRPITEFIERYDPIVLGANNLSGLFEPHYHAFNNKNRFAMYVDSVSPRSRLLIGENIPTEMIHEYVPGDYDTLWFNDVLDAEFDIVDGRIQANCRTISVLLLGVALAMGARRLFAAGMDGYVGKGALSKALFYDERLEPDDYDVILERHRWNERFLGRIDAYVRERGQEGVHIITPTTHQRFYKGIENFLAVEQAAV